MARKEYIQKEYLILIADPDEESYEKLSSHLEKKGHDVKRVKLGKDVVNEVKSKNAKLLIIEHNLEPQDGVEITAEIREDAILRKLPIIFYSDEGDKYTQIAAYRAGADLFIKKGIKPSLFTAQMEALLRRCYEMDDDEIRPVKKYGEIEINEEQVTVFKNGNPLKLSKKEFEILLLLSSKPGKVYKRQDILASIWEDDVIVDDRNIDTHIKKLRKKLGKEYIQTSRGMGYKFKIK
jgi:two-component system alkaline phosphatase synthesis response regulator PhoP